MKKKPNTRLWKVERTYKNGRYTILVSKGPIKGSYGNKGMIRACTAKAAGRIYLKNLPKVIAKIECEVEPYGCNEYLDKKDLQFGKRLTKGTTIRVIK